eukprot:5631153-Lingulodinium_polyedra.AAC.1
MLAAGSTSRLRRAHTVKYDPLGIKLAAATSTFLAWPAISNGKNPNVTRALTPSTVNNVQCWH